MKTQSPLRTCVHAIGMIYIASLFTFSCEEKQIDPSLKITGAFPNSNPIGGPVRIVGVGFGENAKLYFDGIEAIIDQRSDTFLTTIVPTGLSGSGISILVKNGTLQAELADYFAILSAYPNNLPVSPPSIYIPIQPPSTAFPFTVEDEDFVWHLNVFDPKHLLKFLHNVNGADSPSSVEKISLDGNNYVSPLTTDGKLLFDFDPITHTVHLSSVEIKRSQSEPSPHPYDGDEYSAQYFSINSFTFSDEFLQALDPDATLTDNFLLLESKTTGRQYLFVVYCPNEFQCF